MNTLLLPLLIAPDTEFRVVGGAGEDPGYDLEMKKRARDIPNIEWVGFVPPPEMDDHYRGAAVYLNTSELEGLPNAFLQSWAHGVPTVSAGVDPDGVIREKGLGGVASEPSAMASILRDLLDNPPARLEAGRRAWEHVRENHDIHTVGGLAENYLLEALRRRRNPA